MILKVSERLTKFYISRTQYSQSNEWKSRSDEWSDAEWYYWTTVHHSCDIVATASLEHVQKVRHKNNFLYALHILHYFNRII